MKTLRFAVSAASGFRTLCFALFTAACASWAAPAVAATIYTLTADATGTRTQLNPNTQLPIAPFTTQFSGGVELDFTSTGSIFNLQGQVLIIPIASATFLPQGGNLASIILQPNTYFGVGIGPYVGLAGFGIYDSSIPSFDPYLEFAGAGLDTYDGFSSLAPVSVTMNQFNPFRTTRLGNLVEWNFADTSFTNAKFSAITDVPEPATLVLFGAGFAGVAAMRRRRKAKKTA
jgi:hypothetical protein